MTLPILPEYQKLYKIPATQLHRTLTKAYSTGDISLAEFILTDSVLSKKLTTLSPFNHEGILQACKKGYLEMIRELMEMEHVQDTINIFNIKEMLPFAIESNNEELIRYLANFLSREHVYSQEIVNNCLYSACRTGNLTLVQFVFNSPIFPVKPDVNFDNGICLYISARYDHLNIVDYLLTSSELKTHANINNEVNPVVLACNKPRSKKMLDFLFTSEKLTVKPDIHLKNDKILVESCRHNTNLNFLKYILKSKSMTDHADINAQEGKAFIAACYSNDLKLVKFLLEDKTLKENLKLEYVNPWINTLIKANKKEILDYLIYEYKLPYTEELKATIQYPHYIKLFELREMNSQLEQQLDKENVMPSKKHKI